MNDAGIVVVQKMHNNANVDTDPHIATENPLRSKIYRLSLEIQTSCKITIKHLNFAKLSFNP